MLARPETMRCVECGLPYDSSAFDLHEGRVENGPAYWSDEGLLCSPRCSLAHYQKRRAAGTLRNEPAPDPLEADPLRVR